MDVPRTADAVKRASVKTSVNSHMDTDCVYAWDMANLERENAALADALRVRIDRESTCPDCGEWVADFPVSHAETCRHFATERKVMEAA